MFNIGTGELLVIAVVALLLLGPTRLPEVARTFGKYMRSFRRQADEVRQLVEREFYRVDADIKGGKGGELFSPREGGVAREAVVANSSAPTASSATEETEGRTSELAEAQKIAPEASAGSTLLIPSEQELLPK